MPYEGREDSIYRRTDGLIRTHTLSENILLNDDLPMNFEVQDNRSELEQLLNRFKGTNETKKEIENFLTLHKELRTKAGNLPRTHWKDASSLSDYLSILKHKNFNECVFEQFKEEIFLRAENYMKTHSFQEQKIHTDTDFNASLPTTLAYVTRERNDQVSASTRSKRFTRKLTEERNERRQEASGYEILLYARSLGMPIIMNTYDNRFVSEQSASFIIQDIYAQLDTEKFMGKKLTQEITKQFQKRTSFTPPEQLLQGYFSHANEQKDIKLLLDTNNQKEQKQNYA